MLDAFLKQLPRTMLVTIAVVSVIVCVEAALGKTWEAALTEAAADASRWTFVALCLALYSGWLRKRKESASAV
jgi:hypothetical protein